MQFNLNTPKTYISRAVKDSPQLNIFLKQKSNADVKMPFRDCK